MSSTIHRARCKCGGAMDVSAPRFVADRALALFWRVHQGDGHGECDGRTAARARRKAEKDG